MFEVKRYTSEMAREWNEFVRHSKNGTFLFDRNYMDYHSDRFRDHSLVVTKDGSTCALFPANYDGNIIYTHQGLTYGGLVIDRKATTMSVCSMFDAINETLSKEGFHNVVYKSVPWIYHSMPAEEPLYALYKCCNAHLTVREISSSIMLKKRIRFSESRRSGIRKGIANGLKVCESDDIDDFWNILESNLSERYGAKPVHTPNEMKLLKSRFQNNIKLYVTRQDGKILGGTILYITPQVIHTQYISASKEGKRLGALDVLFDKIINEWFVNHEYFDFGKSTEACGRYLNESLIFQKEGFGGRGICYDTYEWTL